MITIWLHIFFDSFEKFLEKYKPEENNMFFVTTKGKNCYSDVDFSNMEEVFVLFGKETKGLPEDILQKYIHYRKYCQDAVRRDGLGFARMARRV